MCIFKYKKYLKPRLLKILPFMWYSESRVQFFHIQIQNVISDPHHKQKVSSILFLNR